MLRWLVIRTCDQNFRAIKFITNLHSGCVDTVTRSSPRWWSGSSMTPHDVLCLCSLINDPSVWGAWGLGWAQLKARPWVPISSPLTHMVLFLTVFELFSWLQKTFPPIQSHGYDDKYRSTSYRFVKQQKQKASSLIRWRCTWTYNNNDPYVGWNLPFLYPSPWYHLELQVFWLWG